MIILFQIIRYLACNTNITANNCYPTSRCNSIENLSSHMHAYIGQINTDSVHRISLDVENSAVSNVYKQ